jgi:fibro-slime domain-containing protein
MRKLWSLVLTAAMLLSLAAVSVGELTSNVAATETNPPGAPTGIETLWGLPNGMIMEDGAALLHYGTYDLLNMYYGAVERNARFGAAAVAEELFMSDAARESFAEEYGDWYLVDRVYSKKHDPYWPESSAGMTEEEITAFQAKSSVAYFIAPEHGGIAYLRVILVNREEEFKIYIEKESDGVYIAPASVQTIAEIITNVPVDESDAAPNEVETEPNEVETEMPDAPDYADIGTPDEPGDSELEPGIAEPEAEEAPDEGSAETEEAIAAPVEEAPVAPEIIEPVEPEPTESMVVESELVEPVIVEQGSAETETLPGQEIVSAEAAVDVSKTQQTQGGAAGYYYYETPEYTPAFELVYGEPETADISAGPVNFSGGITVLSVSITESAPMSEPEPVLPAGRTPRAVSGALGKLTDGDTGISVQSAPAPPLSTHTGQVTADIKYLPVTFYDYEGMVSGSAAGTFNENAWGTAGYYNLLFGRTTSTSGAAAAPWNNNVSAIFAAGTGVRLGIAASELNNYDNTDIPKFQLAGNLTTPNNQNLFPTGNDTITESMISAYNVQFPFIYNNGEYSFDSNKNHIHIYNNSAGQNLPLYSGQQFNGIKGANELTQGPGWFPFDTGDHSTATTANEAHDIYFGFRMDLPFFMPENGKINNQAMEYTFSGDDDVWIYLDGQLVLDLGGTHGAMAGSINFATGAVIVGKAAGRVDPSKNNDNKTSLNNQEQTWNLYEAVGNTPVIPGGAISRDSYKRHMFTMFYMERGGYSSNCSMSFNLPALPLPEEKQMNVYKLADGEDTSGDVNFEFDVYVANSEVNLTASELQGMTDEALTAAGIERTQKPTTKNNRFTADVKFSTDEETKYVRVIECPKLHPNSSAEIYSTVYLSESNDGLITTGKDSGWRQYTKDATTSIYCVNYTTSPITVKKFDYDRPTETISNVSFTLKKVDNGTESPVSLPDGVTLTTDANGGFEINHPYTWAGKMLSAGTYRLYENPRVTGYSYSENSYVEFVLSQNGNSLTISNKPTISLGGEQQTLWADTSSDGLTLNIYNKPLRGQIVVEKKLTDTDDGGYQNAQGQSIFLFELKKLDAESNVLETWVRELIYDYTSSAKNEVLFDELRWDYIYQLKELNVSRYSPTQVVIDNGSSTLYDSEDGAKITVSASSLNHKVTLTNDRIYGGYLSSTSVKPNSFEYQPAAYNPATGTPIVHTVNIVKGEHTLQLTVANGGSIEITQLASLELSESEKDMLSQNGWGIAKGTESSTDTFGLFTKFTNASATTFTVTVQSNS